MYYVNATACCAQHSYLHYHLAPADLCVNRFIVGSSFEVCATALNGCEIDFNSKKAIAAQKRLMAKGFLIAVVICAFA